MVKYTSTYRIYIYIRIPLQKSSAKDLSNDAYPLFLCCCCFSPDFLVVGGGGGGSDFLYKSICCGYSFAIQMGNHNMCIYKEVDKHVNPLAVI